MLPTAQINLTGSLGKGLDGLRGSNQPQNVAKISERIEMNFFFEYMKSALFSVIFV